MGVLSILSHLNLEATYFHEVLEVLTRVHKHATAIIISNGTITMEGSVVIPGNFICISYAIPRLLQVFKVKE